MFELNHHFVIIKLILYSVFLKISNILYFIYYSEESSLIQFINSSWKKRNSSWTYMHFKLSNISTDPFELIQKKVKVLTIIQRGKF